MENTDYNFRQLEKEKPVLLVEIRDLYQELDRKFRLDSASCRIEFRIDEEALGAYDRDEEVFRFSLPFLAFSSPVQLSRSDRIDLYKHEYAHYMVHHIDIPKEYLWEQGVHGSAWKYCCSLVECVPSPYYQAGESRRKQNYEKVIEKPKKLDYKYSSLLDRYQREQEDRKKQGSIAAYKVGDTVDHPKYGSGIITGINQGEGSVQLEVTFAPPADVKKIDQKWLLRSQHKAAGS